MQLLMPNEIPLIKMSTKDLELFYTKLLEASVILTETESLADLFEEDLARDMGRLNWLLQEAIKNRHTKIINFLLSSGVKIIPLNEANQTALHIAVYHEFLEIVDSLFPHCDDHANHTDRNGLSHFHISCITGNLEVVADFLRNGVDLDHRCDHSNDPRRSHWTALHLAVEHLQVRVVELLLRHGADPNAADRYGATPLHLACRGSGDTYGRKQNYPLDGAAFLGHEDELNIARLLVRYGAEVNTRDCTGDTPLLYVFRGDHLERIDAFDRPFVRDARAKRDIVRGCRESRKNKIAFLIEEGGADVRLANNRRETILHLAIGDLRTSRLPRVLTDILFEDAVNVEMVEICLKRGAHVDAMNDRGETPLQIAVSLLSFEVVEVLLKHGAEVGLVRFDREDENSCFHYYADVLPCLEATENLIKILEALASRGLILSRRDNLAILKFLVRNNVDCRYADSKDVNASYKLQNLLELGGAVNIKAALDKFPVNSSDSTYPEQTMRKRVIQELCKHLSILDRGSFHLSEEMRNCLRDKVASLERCLLRFVASSNGDHNPSKAELELHTAEILKTKATMLSRYTSLHDVLRLSPQRSYARIKNCDYREFIRSEDFRRDFPYCGGIIKGHFAKSLVRRYVARSSTEYLRALLPVHLPELCCQRIFSYLSNDNLLDLCLANYSTNE